MTQGAREPEMQQAILLLISIVWFLYSFNLHLQILANFIFKKSVA